MMHRLGRGVRIVLATLPFAVGAICAAVGGPPVDATATTTASAAPDSLDGIEIRLAKIGVSRFLLDHVDRPVNVAAPCPLLSSASVGWYVGQLGLAWSQREYVVSVVWDTQVGAGLVAVRCGVNLNSAADPPGSVALQLDAAVLDGQATFDQYAVRIGGRDVVVGATTEPAGEIAGRCTNGGTSCTFALHLDGLVLTLWAVNLPADHGATLVQQLLTSMAPEIVVNLGALPAPP